jgi:hypothetical protein
MLGVEPAALATMRESRTGDKNDTPALERYPFRFEWVALRSLCF